MSACTSRVANGCGATLFRSPTRGPPEVRNLREAAAAAAAAAAAEQVVNLITMRNASQGGTREGATSEHDLCGPRRRQLHCRERIRQKQRGRRSQSRRRRTGEERKRSEVPFHVNNIQSVSRLVRASGAWTGLSEEVCIHTYWNLLHSPKTKYRSGNGP